MIKHLTEFIHGLVNNKKVLILGYGREGRSTLPVVIEAGGAAVIAVADAKPVKDGLPEGVTRARALCLIERLMIIHVI